MGPQNSLELAVQLFRCIFRDVAAFHPEIKSSLERDLLTIETRSSREGLGFFTKTLPMFGKAFDLALLGKHPLTSRLFGKQKGSALPRFLRGMLGCVFDRSTGMILTNPDVGMISSIRQVCFCLYKLEIAHEPAMVEKRISAFIDTDLSLPSLADLHMSEHREVLGCASALLRAVFEDFDPLDITPSHGPGEVATGELPHEKFKFRRQYESLEGLYGPEYFQLSWTQFCDDAQDNSEFKVTVPEDYSSSRLAVVPKDSRGPRLICLEPLELQWIQQGLKTAMYDWLENHPLTKGNVNFTDQTINRDLALESSASQEFVTLDMQEASDRVSVGLVQMLFRDLPILDALMASRSRVIKLPNGEFVRTVKFAPMGSAVCFPVESVVFWSLCCAILHLHYHVPLLLTTKMVKVYGDDIILPTSYFEEVMRVFPSFGLLFNGSKCCTSGFFRESCGMDAYNGVDVTPIRVKKTPPKDLNDTQALVAYLAQSNELWTRCYYNTANYLSSIVEGIIGSLPVVTSKNVSFLSLYARVGVQDSRPRRWNKDFQRFEFKSWVSEPSQYMICIDNWGELFRSVLNAGQEGFKAGCYSQRYKLKLRKRFI